MFGMRLGNCSLWSVLEQPQNERSGLVWCDPGLLWGSGLSNPFKLFASRYSTRDMNHTLFTDIRIICFIVFIVTTCFYKKDRDGLFRGACSDRSGEMDSN